MCVVSVYACVHVYMLHVMPHLFYLLVHRQIFHVQLMYTNCCNIASFIVHVYMYCLLHVMPHVFYLLVHRQIFHVQ